MRTALLLLLLATVARADDQATLACPLVVIAEALTTSDPVASDNSYYDLWQFAGTVEQPVTIDMTSTVFDAFLILLDPAGRPVADNDDALAGSTNSRITLKLTATGTWTVVVNSLAAGKLGAYTLTLACGGGRTARRRAVRGGP